MKKRLTPDEQSLVNMRDTLRTLKSRVASLERQNARLLATDYQQTAEREIALLEERCTDLTRLCELAELEVLQLKRQLQERKVA